MSELPTPPPNNTVPSNVTLKLPKPSYVIIQSPDNQTTYREDSFSVLRMLTNAEKQPSEERRWETVRKWLAEKLKLEIDEVTENIALSFHNQVVDLTNAVKKEMAGDVFTIASSAPPIQESQQTS